MKINVRNIHIWCISFKVIRRMLKPQWYSTRRFRERFRHWVSTEIYSQSIKNFNNRRSRITVRACPSDISPSRCTVLNKKRNKYESAIFQNSTFRWSYLWEREKNNNNYWFVGLKKIVVESICSHSYRIFFLYDLIVCETESRAP